MATVTIPEQEQVLTETGDIRSFLARYSIWYRRFDEVEQFPQDAPEEEILAAFDGPIRELEESGGYRAVDVIDVSPEVPGLDAMLAKFNKEHWHDEDEVRFIVRGRGIFHVNPPDEPVFRIEVERGDMINVPKGTRHWFDLCEDKNIRAIRLFQDPSGWTPHYTGSAAEEGFQPLCFGPQYLPPTPTL